MESYSTKQGKCYTGDCIKLIESKEFKKYHNKVQLLFTSPPFPLLAKKKYGNMNGQEFINWFGNLSESFSKMIKDDGSIVIELGNAWNSGLPTMSTVPMEALLEFKKRSNLHLCQEFICHNPSRLPGPAEWVNKHRVRVKDSFTRLWWLSKTPNPKADNKKILTEYSSGMKKLLKRKNYNHGLRPSGHDISEKSFLTKHKGAIPASFIENIKYGENSLSISNTDNDAHYFNFCKKYNLEKHPARIQKVLVAYFINFLTDKNDLVFDPFGGSNITGYVSEYLNRKWISTELKEEYNFGSSSRFLKKNMSNDKDLYEEQYDPKLKLNFKI